MFGTYNIKRYYQDMRDAPLIYDMRAGFAAHIRGEKAERKPPEDIVSQLLKGLRQDKSERDARPVPAPMPVPTRPVASQTDAAIGSMVRARRVDDASRAALGGLPQDVADTTRALNITAETVLPEHATERSAAVREAHGTVHREALDDVSSYYSSFLATPVPSRTSSKSTTPSTTSADEEYKKAEGKKKRK